MRGGPGETQIELDKRMIGDAIKRTKERLTKVKKQRSTQRRQRDRRHAFNISLVGYTNAGKSTLFNALVKARAYAADQLFATLDTTTRQLYLGESGRSASVSDTVGFIRDLPHGLIDAFQATLQEAADADLLLHVVDASNANFPEQMAEVKRVIHEIGADTVPQWLVFNKIDNLPNDRQPLLVQDHYEVDGVALPRIFLSAHTGQGLSTLRQMLSEEVMKTMPEVQAPADQRFDLDNFGEN
jgi:GTP-binding protein HflX